VSGVYRLVDSDGYQISAGLFNEQSMLRMSLEVFTDSKPEFHGLANETKMMTGAEVHALFAPLPK
jgi:hypothetical protein